MEAGVEKATHSVDRRIPPHATTESANAKFDRTALLDLTPVDTEETPELKSSSSDTSM